MGKVQINVNNTSNNKSFGHRNETNEYAEYLACSMVPIAPI